MSNNNHHNLQCGFAEDLVSFLYGEINSAEKAEFEKHLDNCSNCDQELAGLGFVRSSIGDLREEMLSVLETQTFEIPYNESQKTFATSAKSKTSRSWIDRLRNLFSLSSSWATATSAFAFLVVLVGITIFVFNFSKPNQVLEVKIEGITNQNALKVTPNETDFAKQSEEINQPEQNLAVEKTPEKIDSKINNINPVPQKNVAEVNPKSFKTPKNVRENRKPNEKTIAQTNGNPAKDSKNTERLKTDAPKLTNFSEEDDNSLRLADLFDEVGSK
jgi:hypothetical protein